MGASSRRRTCLILRPISGLTPEITRLFFRARAVLLPNGIVFSAAGLQRLNTRPFGTIVAALWSAISGTWSTTGSLSHGRYCHTLTLLHEGKALAAGGLTSTGATSSAELYTP